MIIYVRSIITKHRNFAMLCKRKSLGDDVEVNRQQSIWSVLQNEIPLTILERKAAAILNHASIHPATITKVYKNFDTITQLIESDEDLNNRHVISKIKKIIKKCKLNVGDVLYLPTKLPMITNVPSEAPVYNYKLKVTKLSNVNLQDFEKLCFNNKVLFQFYDNPNTSFASYVYQNILYSLSAESVDQLSRVKSWQAKLAVLIDHTKFNDAFATSTFYKDKVDYLGISYDTSFIPKYNVQNLKRIKCISESTNSFSLIKFYDAVNPRITLSIPADYLNVFKVFPFKQNYYIDQNGKIHFIDKCFTKKRSVRVSIQHLCNVEDLESAIYETSNNLSLQDVISYAINVDNIKDAGVSLAVLRCMVGPTLVLDSFKIPIPTINEILSWLSLDCANSSIMLPIKVDVPNTSMYVNLIKDISKSCSSKWGASFVCHSYHMMEAAWYNVKQNLSTDAEFYVYATIILQEYNFQSYKNFRNKLKPIFGCENINLDKYPKSKRLFTNSCLNDRLGTHSEPLLKPTDIGISFPCDKDVCHESFEFVNNQLKDLAKYGDVLLNDLQMSAFITLMIR